MAGTRSEKHKHSRLVALAGASFAGAVETCLFYTPEAISRRLQVNKTKLYTYGTSPAVFASNLRTAIFGNAVEMGFVNGLRDLYSGIGVGIFYKFMQRGYKFGGQKIVEYEMHQHAGHIFDDYFGQRNAKLMLAGISGMLVGIGEAPLLLPLDAIKIRYQTNKDSVRGKWIWNILLEERVSLYNGLGWTMLRNAVGSFTLFTTNAAMKEYVCKPRHEKSKTHLTIAEKIFSSSVAAIMSVLVSNPPDVIKTRIQSGKEANNSGVKIANELLRKEGMFALFKGVIAKAGATVPKLTFALVAADSVAEWISDVLEKSNTPKPK